MVDVIWVLKGKEVPPQAVFNISLVVMMSSCIILSLD